MDNEPFEIMYVDYKLKMNPYGIQFCDNEDKLTMEQLERHGFSSGDKFVLYTDTEGKICLKKDRDWSSNPWPF